MRIALFTALLTTPFLGSCEVETSTNVEFTTSTSVTQELEAGCGACIYHLEGAAGCPLAVVVGDQAMLVTGSDFDAMSAGLCTERKRVRIAGQPDGNSFVASAVELVE